MNTATGATVYAAGSDTNTYVMFSVECLVLNEEHSTLNTQH